MYQSVFCFVLLLALGTISSFTFSKRWITRITTIKSSLVDGKSCLTQDEVYIGNLPSSIDERYLRNILGANGLRGYNTFKLAPYGTSDDLQYGAIKFKNSYLASTAIHCLEGRLYSPLRVDVSLMPNCSRVGIFFRGSEGMSKVESSRVWTALDSVRTACKFVLRKKHVLEGVYIQCGNSGLAARVHHLLKPLLPDFRIFYLPSMSRPPTLAINNLDPSITTSGLIAVLTNLLGSSGFRTAGVSLSLLGHSTERGTIEFKTQEDADRAFAILRQCKVMNRPLSVVNVADLEHSVRVYISNIDPDEPSENIEQLCNDVVGEKDAVLFVRKNRRIHANESLPSCVVFFNSLDKLKRCINALNGKVWKGKVLTVRESNTRVSGCEVYVDKVPASVSRQEALAVFQHALGPLRIMVWGDENVLKGSRHVILWFATREEAKFAVENLSGFNLKGSRLFAREGRSGNS